MKKKPRLIIGIAIVGGIALVAAGTFAALSVLAPKSSPKAAIAPSTTATTSSSSAAANVDANLPGVKLDVNKDYGNKYANGVLPVGDKKYSTTAAAVGYPYVCSQYAHNLMTDQGGAQATNEPWFNADKTTYDSTKKLHVAGSVKWNSSYSMTDENGVRTIVTNGLPSHVTGVFPIASNDPAYAYDRNPNTVQSHTVTYALADSPTYGTPGCIGGKVGIMNSGIPLYSAFDAGGRDAGAWEVQDECAGHPQVEGEYHYHTLSSCIGDVSVTNIIGYAFDGYPITGPKISSNNILTTSDLDECHGLTSFVSENGKMVATYHYVMTQDFPYSIGCFRSKPIDPPRI